MLNTVHDDGTDGHLADIRFAARFAINNLGKYVNLVKIETVSF